MRRIFEKYLRKKKLDPNLLEGLAVLIISIPVLLAVILLGIYGDFVYEDIMLNGGRSKTLGEAILIPKIAKIIYLAVLFIAFRFLFRYFRNEFGLSGKKDRNVIFVDETKNPVGLHFFYENTTSFLFIFFAEPYVYRMKFLVDTFTGDDYSCYRKSIFFNLPPHKSFRLNRDYGIYERVFQKKEQKTKLKRSKHFRVKSKSYLNKYNGKDYHEYTYYITYEKAQAFNRLFEIVDLPAFRIIVSEEQKSLLEIHPIEGREYPEEVYELLEKINGMYP